MKSVLWQSDDIARATNGKSTGDKKWKAKGVSIDSRTLQKGDLFVALKGPVHDGHDHVEAALAAGAAGVVVDHMPEDAPDNAPLIVVKDTFKALEDLGRAGRARAEARIVAVTGSVGKTSTKEMLRLMLGECGETFASEGSFNNHWGVPLSLSRLSPQAKFGVFELGMNHAGELTKLSGQVLPHVSLITNIEAVHLEFFPSVEAIADSKAEIFIGTATDGAAVLNRDNMFFGRLEKSARNRGLAKILSFGIDPKSDARLIECRPGPQGSDISAEILGIRVDYHLGVPGEHLAINSLGALLAAAVTGGDVPVCAASLAQYKLPKGRGVAQGITLADGDITLIDESYNASPVAMRAAIRVLGRLLPGAGGRRILVLGDMRELGDTSPQLHAGLAPDITAAQIDRVYCCGEMMAYLYQALPPQVRGFHAADSSALAERVAADIHGGDIVTVKGSKAVGMHHVIEAIFSLDTSKKRKLAG